MGRKFEKYRGVGCLQGEGWSSDIRVGERSDPCFVWTGGCRSGSGSGNNSEIFSPPQMRRKGSEMRREPCTNARCKRNSEGVKRK
ncbi:hypothetical protein CEXT_357851 [Caerostris extrusa]|uniref:Uncharacterized protein n=1 Tax=Caerostris extrusa TaxID=172846 RepID=A0AAV4XVY6_CAEEX|nr:hypothetical protein CEXT_357851 [Caerostris extrusa]